MLMNKTPCSLYWALNLPIAVFSAALLMAYGAPLAMLNLVMRSRSAIPVEMAMTFLAEPFRMSGR